MSAAAHAGLLRALKAYWVSKPELVAALRVPQLDEVDQGVPPAEGAAPPHVVLSQTGSGVVSKGSRGSKIEWYLLQFAVYHQDDSAVIPRAVLMADVLERFRGPPPPALDGGYLMAWEQESPSIHKVPDAASAGSRLLYQEPILFRATVGSFRAR